MHISGRALRRVKRKREQKIDVYILEKSEIIRPTIDLAIAGTAVGIALWTSIHSNRVQERIAGQQLELQRLSTALQQRHSQVALLVSNLPFIRLNTAPGRAAYNISLTTAASLDNENHSGYYRSLLPRFDQNHLALALQDTDPALLKLALRVGLKPEEFADGDDRFYVAAGTFDRALLNDLKEREQNIIEALDEKSDYSDMSVSILERKAVKGSYVIVIGSSQSAPMADRTIRNIKRDFPTMTVYKVKTTSLVHGH